jgi:hypothetical protein
MCFETPPFTAPALLRSGASINDNVPDLSRITPETPERPTIHDNPSTYTKTHVNIKETAQGATHPRPTLANRAAIP